MIAMIQGITVPVCLKLARALENTGTSHIHVIGYFMYIIHVPIKVHKTPL